MNPLERSPAAFAFFDKGRNIEWHAHTEYEEKVTVLAGGIELVEREGQTVVNEPAIKEALNDEYCQKILAQLFSFHHLTAEQIHVLAGIGRDKLRLLLPKLHQIGLIEIGWFAPGDNRISVIDNHLVVYRLSDPKTINPLVKKYMEREFYMTTFLGMKVTRGPQHIVHNLMAAEFASDPVFPNLTISVLSRFSVRSLAHLTSK